MTDWPPPLSFNELLEKDLDELHRLKEEAWRMTSDLQDLSALFQDRRSESISCSWADSRVLSRATWPFLLSLAATLKAWALEEEPDLPVITICPEPELYGSEQGRALHSQLAPFMEPATQYPLDILLDTTADFNSLGRHLIDTVNGEYKEWPVDFCKLIIHVLGWWGQALSDLREPIHSRAVLAASFSPFRHLDSLRYPVTPVPLGMEALAKAAGQEGRLRPLFSHDLPVVAADDQLDVVELVMSGALSRDACLALARTYLTVPGNRLATSPWTWTRKDTNLHSVRRGLDGGFMIESDGSVAVDVPSLREPDFEDCDALRAVLVDMFVEAKDVEGALALYPLDYISPKVSPDHPHPWFAPELTDRASALHRLGYLQGRLAERQDRGDELSFEVLSKVATMAQSVQENNLMLRGLTERKEADSAQIAEILAGLLQVISDLPEVAILAGEHVGQLLADALAERGWDRAKEDLLRRTASRAADEVLELRHGEPWGRLLMATREDLIAVEALTKSDAAELRPLMVLGVCRAFERELKSALLGSGETELGNLADLVARAASNPQVLRDIGERAREARIVDIRNRAAHGGAISLEDCELTRSLIIARGEGLLWKLAALQQHP